MRAAGRSDVDAGAYSPLTGHECVRLERATVSPIRGSLPSAGPATEEEIDDHLRNVDSQQLDLATSPMVSAWARRPGRAGAWLAHFAVALPLAAAAAGLLCGLTHLHGLLTAPLRGARRPWWALLSVPLLGLAECALPDRVRTSTALKWFGSRGGAHGTPQTGTMR